MLKREKNTEFLTMQLYTWRIVRMSVSFSSLSLEEKKRRQSMSTSPCIQPSEIMFLFRRKIKRPGNAVEIATRKIIRSPESLTLSLHITLQELFLFEPLSTKFLAVMPIISISQACGFLIGYTLWKNRFQSNKHHAPNHYLASFTVHYRRQ